MKKFLMLLLASTSIAVADTFIDLNTSFNEERFNILANKANEDQLDAIKTNIKKYAQKVDSLLAQKPSDQQATPEERRKVLNTLAYKALYNCTGWLEENIEAAFDTTNNHRVALWIMKKAVNLLVKDPFSMVSDFVYQDLSQKLSFQAPAHSAHPFFKEKALRQLIPQAFLNDFLKMLVNVEKFNHPTHSTVDDWVLEGKSIEALSALIIREGRQPITLTRKEGFLCLPENTARNNGYIFPNMWENSVYTYKAIDEKEGQELYRLHVNNAEAPMDITLQKAQLDKTVSQLFYDVPEIGALTHTFRHGYCFALSPFDGNYNATQVEGYFKDISSVLGALIKQYGTLHSLNSLKYLANFAGFATVLPLAIKEEGANTQAWEHPLLNKVDLYSFIRVLEKLRDDKNLPEATRNECATYIEICHIKERNNLSFQDAFTEWKAAKKRAAEEAKRRLEEEKNKARQERIAREEEEVKSILQKEMKASPYKEVQDNAVKALLPLLTTKIDHYHWQVESNGKPDPVALTADELTSLTTVVRERVAQYAHPTVAEATRTQAINAVTQQLLTISQDLCASINARLAQGDADVKKKAALQLVTAWNGFALESLINPLRQAIFPKDLADPLKIAADKDVFIQEQQKARAKWGADEAIMNVGAFISNRYNDGGNIADIHTKDIDDCLGFLIQEVVGETPATLEYGRGVASLPFLKSLPKKAKEEIINSKHLNQKKYGTDGLTESAVNMRQDFMAVISWLNALDQLRDKPFIKDNETNANALSAILAQFQGYMEDQIGRCCTGLKSRLFLAKLDMAVFLKKLYDQNG